MIGFYNRDEKSLLRGTDWVFKYSSLRFVFKGLKYNSMDCKRSSRLDNKRSGFSSSKLFVSFMRLSE